MFKSALRDRLAADRDAGPVHALRVAGDQRVPAWQRLAFMQSSVGAAEGHPPQVIDVAGREFDAVRHVALAVLIVVAAAGVGIEQLAVYPGRDDLAGVLVLEADQTAKSASVAQA